MDESKKDRFINWLMKTFSVNKNEDYMVTHIGYKWAGSRMLRETHIRYYDGKTAVIYTN